MAVAPGYLREVAKKALKDREGLPPSRQAGTLVGLARANQLANGENLSLETLIRMRSYLSRAKANYEMARSRGLDNTNSKAIQAYNLWGGPRALAWVNKEIKNAQ